MNKRSLAPEVIQQRFIVEKAPSVAIYPWNVENAPITIKTKARILPEWHEYQGSVGPITYHSQRGESLNDGYETIELIPFGCTTLRIAEFPVR